MDSDKRCFCEADSIETSYHLFADCSWISEVRNALGAWAGVRIVKADAKQSIQWLKRRIRTQFKKETVSAVWGAMIYYTWQARNWRIFRNSCVNTSFVIA